MEQVREYLIDHWKGKLPLWQTFWLNAILLPIVVSIVIASMFVGGVTTTPDGTVEINHGSVFFYSLLTGIVAIWANLGLWKCTKRVRTTEGDPSSRYAVMIQVIMMVVLTLSFILHLVNVNGVSLAVTGYILYMMYQIGR